MSGKLTNETLQKPVYGDVDLGYLEQYIDITDAPLVWIVDSVVKSLNGHDMRVTYEASDNSLIYDICELPIADKENIKAFLRLHRVGKDPAVAHNAALILDLIHKHENIWDTAPMMENSFEASIWTLLPYSPHEKWGERWHVPYLYGWNFDRNPTTTMDDDDLPF